MPVIPLRLCLTAVDRRGVPVCPDLFVARRLAAIAVLVPLSADEAQEQAARDLEATASLVVACRGRAAQAAFLESLRGVEVVCRRGFAVAVDPLVERLRAGVVWS